MTFKEFIALYQGKHVDFDGAFGAQCFDLAQQYNRDVVGGPFLQGGGAIDVFTTYPAAFYMRVANAPANIPPAGSIVIWGPNPTVGTGAYGHIAIAVSGDAQQFTSFDQNWPENSACHLQQHSYDGVLGWLVPRGSVALQPPPPPHPTPPNAAEGLKSLARHVAYLQMHPSVEAVNAFLRAVGEWKPFTS